jgi:sec-independent protein translocase protein TatA
MFGGRLGITELLVILAIVILIFGTKKLRTLGGDLGSAIRNFRSSMKEGEQEGDKQIPKPGEDSADKKPDGH